MRQPKSSTTQISRRTFAKGTLAAVVGLSLSTGSAAAEESVSADLVTGPDEEPIGIVSISEEDGSLTVTYALSDEEYEITETHLHVTDDVDDVPTNKPGNPKVGHFEHSSEHEEGTDFVEHEVDVSDLGDELVVAAQAKVRTEIEEETEEEETADGEETGSDESDEDGEIGILDAEEGVDEDDSEESEENEGDETDEDEEEGPEYEYESAWADGERINDRTHPRHGHYIGSWATYVAYQRTSDESEE